MITYPEEMTRERGQRKSIYYACNKMKKRPRGS